MKPEPKLFGVDINTGPIRIEGEAEINDFLATVKAFKEAAVGTGVAFSLRPLSPVRLLLPSGSGEDNRS
jgi:hypothetical protein